MLPMPSISSTNKITATVSALLLLAACAGTPAGDGYAEAPVEELYNSAVNAMEGNSYALAAARFDEVERQHPYSSWATKSQLMAAYSLYMANKYDDSVMALERFIQLHPSHEDVPYAFYLKGLNYYEQISDVGRDQYMTQNALKSFSELIARFPQSQYGRDAKVKVELTYDHLAGKEMEIGRYYLTRKHYLSAVNRFKNVIYNFQTTTHVPEALHRLVESHIALGLDDEARKIAAVLGHNYPSSAWYRETYALVGDTAAALPSEIVSKPAENDTAKDNAKDNANANTKDSGKETPSWFKFW